MCNLISVTVKLPEQQNVCQSESKFFRAMEGLVTVVLQLHKKLLRHFQALLSAIITLILFQHLGLFTEAILIKNGTV